jgi:probable HAF family extracellular repeat protein
MRYRIGLRTTLLVVGVTLAAAAPARAQHYTFSEFATDVPNLYAANGNGINGSGQIVGTATAGFNDPFLWTPTVANGTSGTTIVIPSGSYTMANGNAINASGEIVGNMPFGSANEGFLFKSGTLTNLGFLAGDVASTATGINATGLICGTSLGPSGYRGQASHAFATTGGALTPLGSFGGGQSVAHSVNDAGEIVGWASTPAGTSDAFIWKAGVLTDLNGAGGFTPPAGFAPGTFLHLAINGAGQVAGSFIANNTFPQLVHPFLWTPSTPQGTSGSSVDLGIIPGNFVQCQASAVNGHGDVVGTCNTPGRGASAVHHAFLYHAGAIIDLDSVDIHQTGVTIQYAQGINDAGQIVVRALIGATPVGALLTPAP